MSASVAIGPAPGGHASWAEWLASLPEPDRNHFVASLTPREAHELEYNWDFWARENQKTPDSDWQTWLNLAGRGWGKTRVGTEWVRDIAERGLINPSHGIALVGATVDDARDIMIDGESGLLEKCPPWFRPHWEPSKRLLTWPNGIWARTYSADKPERLRGKQHAKAWADELAAWRAPEAWAHLLLGLRLGANPQCVVTTTPKPTPQIRELVADPTTRVTLGTTYENRSNLAASFFSKIIKRYEGTRLGQQELLAKILDDNPGALWKRAMIDALRRPLHKAHEIRKRCKCVVVAIDPSVSGQSELGGETFERSGTADDDAKQNECGIIVVGLGDDDHGYILDDASGTFSPSEWGRIAVWKYHQWEANACVAEINQGGQLVVDNLRAVTSGKESSHNRALPVWTVRAAVGKKARAEPVATLYEQGRVHHVGCFGTLEDQMCQWDPIQSRESPDRIDAAVWGLTRLMLGELAPKRGALPGWLSSKLG